MQYVLKYDYRTDGGPRLVGPFASHSEATAHAQKHLGVGWSASYSVAPLTAPEED